MRCTLQISPRWFRQVFGVQLGEDNAITAQQTEEVEES